jgi:hypothetical protein
MLPLVPPAFNVGVNKLSLTSCHSRSTPKMCGKLKDCCEEMQLLEL